MDQDFPMLCFPTFFHTYTSPTPPPKQTQNAKAVLTQHCGMPPAFPQDNLFPLTTCPSPFLPLELAIRVKGRAAEISLDKLAANIPFSAHFELFGATVQ